MVNVSQTYMCEVGQHNLPRLPTKRGRGLITLALPPSLLTLLLGTIWQPRSCAPRRSQTVSSSRRRSTMTTLWWPSLRRRWTNCSCSGETLSCSREDAGEKRYVIQLDTVHLILCIVKPILSVLAIFAIIRHQFNTGLSDSLELPLSAICLMRLYG